MVYAKLAHFPVHSQQNTNTVFTKQNYLFTDLHFDFKGAPHLNENNVQN